jgi:hypothetical protein
MLDKAALVIWLRERSDVNHSALVGAIYQGLADRVERGDFDEENDDE